MSVFKMSAFRRVSATVAIIFAVALPMGEAEAYEIRIKIANNQNLTTGHTALKEGDVDKAVENFLRALKSNLTTRQMFLAHNGLCIGLNKQEEYFSALDHCDQAIDIRKSYFGGYVNRGNVYLSMEKYDEAITNYLKAKELVPASFIPDRNIEIANMLRGGARLTSAPMPPELLMETCEPPSGHVSLVLN